MSNWDELATRTPLNTTAAKVVSQKGVGVEQTDKEKLAELKDTALILNSRIIMLEKKSPERIELAKQYFALGLEISKLKKKTAEPQFTEHDKYHYLAAMLNLCKKEIPITRYRQMQAAAKKIVKESGNDIAQAGEET